MKQPSELRENNIQFILIPKIANTISVVCHFAISLLLDNIRVMPYVLIWLYHT